MIVGVEHNFDIDETVYMAPCVCGCEVRLTTPFAVERCDCGRTWKLDAVLVAGGDSEGDA